MNKKMLFLTALIVTFGFSACGGGGDSSHIQYVALGASDATGIGANPITDGYVYKIEEELDKAGKQTDLLNLGIPSAKIDLIKDTALKIALDKDPDLITIFTGGNDIVGGADPIKFEQKLGEVFQDLRDNTKAFVVTATLPDLTKAPRFIKEPSVNVTSERLNQFNSAIIRQANLHNFPIVDLRNVEVNQDYTASDGFHPNGAGYAIIAAEFLKIIQPHFPKDSM